MKIGTIGLLGILAIGLSGCITDKTILTNDQGETKTCETKGRIGIVSGVMLHERHRSCVEKAKAEGYREVAPQASTSS